jgi:predicted kinase
MSVTAPDFLASLAPQPPGFAVDWADLERRFPWPEAMAATPQGAEFHAEGDVWIHTRMVGDWLAAEPRFRALDAGARAIVFAGALLHDLGKPACTRAEPDGRISARGHSARGEILARRMLWEAGVDPVAREQVCGLIRLHQIPFFLIDQPRADAIRGALRASLIARCDWLALVAEADARGRRCRDDAAQQKIADNTALFAELCGELGVLTAPRAFPSDHARFLYFHRDGRDPDYAAHDDSRCEVVLMCGLPGSGKDRWLAEQLSGTPVISLDRLRHDLDVDPEEAQGPVIAAAREEAREHLRAGRGFAWNATNLGRPLRAQLVELFTGYGARVRIVYREVSAERQRRQNRDRDARVPERVIERMLDRWTLPDPTEAHRIDLAIDSAPPRPARPR